MIRILSIILFNHPNSSILNPVKWSDHSNQFYLQWLLSQFPGKGKNQNKHGGQSILTVGDRKLSALTRSIVWVPRKLERGTTISYFLRFGIRFLEELNHDRSKVQWQVKQQKIPSFDLIFFLLVSRFKNNRQLHFRHGTYVEIWFKSVWSATYSSCNHITTNSSRLISLEWRNVAPRKRFNERYGQVVVGVKYLE